jgi:hypothetical protein
MIDLFFVIFVFLLFFNIVCNCRMGNFDIEGGKGKNNFNDFATNCRDTPMSTIVRRYLNIHYFGKVMCERLATDSHITIIQAANPPKNLPDGGTHGHPTFRRQNRGGVSECNHQVLQQASFILLRLVRH